jgi:predicted Zn finger-like uncharacterized protein
MSMVTSCPACTTTFRITEEQLRQRQGKVRCGKCRGVFDAFKSLTTLADDPVPEPRAAPLTAAEARTAAGQGRLDIDGHARPMRPAFVPRPDSSTTDRNRTLWLAATIVLALLLAAQAAYGFRDRLAAAWPGSRPLLEAMCAALSCAVAWPQRPDLLAIEASELQADPVRPNVIVLMATVRNRGSIDVARPALELTLTDTQDRTLARRVFLPAEYLPGAQDASGAMPARAEVEVRLQLDTADLKPAGYRLFLFYP